MQLYWNQHYYHGNASKLIYSRRNEKSFRVSNSNHKKIVNFWNKKNNFIRISKNMLLANRN